MHDAENACDTGRLARTVESAEWLRDSVGSSEWACPTCQRLAEVVLPALQMLERRIRAVEGVRDEPSLVTKQLQTQERELLIQALREAHGMQARAAASLGISPRRMLYKVRKFQLDEYCLFRRTRRKGQRHDP